jgi:hypothetical protein
MILLVKRRFNGKRGIFSENGIGSLATNEEIIDTSFSRAKQYFNDI